MKIENRDGYKICNGTYYSARTSDSMVLCLESIRLSGDRVRFQWGNTETGKDWGDVYDVEGKIGRSTGPIKTPILVHNSRSRGGTHVLDHCIVLIRYSNKRNGGTIYRHPKYHI